MKTESQDEALKLWDELRDHFINMEKTIIRIIETEAWKPLGYATFAEAWSDRMSGVRLAGEVRAHVVYFMLSEGGETENISGVTGIGTGSVEDLKRQKSNGVPPEAATLVRQHRRKAPREAFRLTVEVSHDERERFSKICKTRGLDMSEEALVAIRDRFAKLEIEP